MTASAIPVAGARRARMGRYALWQAGDFVINIAIITIILFALIGVVALMNLHLQEEIALSQKRTLPPMMKLTIFRDIYAMFAMVAPIIAVSGVISQDRSAGFTRFLFAKPVSPRWFYFQSLFVRFVGYLVVGHILILAYSFYEPPAYTPKMLVDLTVNFLIVGGITFLFSAVSKYDGLLAIVALLTSSIFWSKWERAQGWRHAVVDILPPVERVGELHAWVLGMNPLGSIADVPFPTKWALWLAGYGLACIVLGLYLLRRIPLTRA
jgi:hypothetical protein